ncbi:transcriptional regulator, DeoR family [Actinopolyspora alba]|uniref:Lactose phosphotransferase system repressor n=1 Tax=Actinopolyspora alba TaxID=673379 RepID=A0A1I1XME7_9ACTN|nr:DeoR/GlpR family DNA-binding transcription regulator [Actinopolyspora alba]SFE08594.1 transcriptional regulator, DeoR family [Actinopolyspora alba]
MAAARPSEAAVEQRRQEVLRFVVDRGRARIDELAEHFGVSLMTMHRDLDDLAARHLLHKLRGRVESFPSLTMETATRFRVGLHVAEKEALAAVAVDEVRPNTTVVLDDSSTLFPCARRLTAVESLTVVTNSFGVARTLSGAEREVLVLGGRFRGEFDSCTGPDVLRGLSRLRADLAVMSATAITDGRLFHPMQDFAEIKEAMCAAAERSVLLVDHSKFGKTATYSHGTVAAFDLVVTDEATPEEEIAAIREFGTEVRVTHVDPAAEFPGEPVRD